MLNFFAKAIGYCLFSAIVQLFTSMERVNCVGVTTHLMHRVIVGFQSLLEKLNV